MMRFLHPLKSSSNFSDTLSSEIVCPGFSTFVESESKARTPLFPSSPNRARSIISPFTGVKSILKSPVCTTVPMGVFIARATASAIEWLTFINSISKAPSLNLSPAFFVKICVFVRRSLSSSLNSIIPAERGVANTGTSSSGSKNGIAPM